MNELFTIDNYFYVLAFSCVVTILLALNVVFKTILKFFLIMNKAIGGHISNTIKEMRTLHVVNMKRFDSLEKSEMSDPFKLGVTFANSGDNEQADFLLGMADGFDYENNNMQYCSIIGRLFETGRKEEIENVKSTLVSLVEFIDLENEEGEK